jgi:hypothetical protein
VSSPLPIAFTIWGKLPHPLSLPLKAAVPPSPVLLSPPPSRPCLCVFSEGPKPAVTSVWVPVCQYALGCACSAKMRLCQSGCPGRADIRHYVGDCLCPPPSSIDCQSPAYLSRHLFACLACSLLLHVSSESLRVTATGAAKMNRLRGSRGGLYDP